MPNSEFTQIDDENLYYSQGWFAGIDKDADYEMTEHQSLNKLRLTASRLMKNNFMAVGLKEALIDFILGSGVTVRYPPNKKAEKNLVKALKMIDKERFLSLADIAETLVEAAVTRGDVLINMINTPYVNSNYTTSVEIVEANRVKTPLELQSDDTIVEGVKKDSRGREIGYYVRKLTKTANSLKNHYYEAKEEDFDYLPAYKNGRRVVWLYKSGSLRPSQTRALPLLTPIMNLLRYINDYLETTLIQARVSASFSAFIHTNNPEGTKESMESSLGNSIQAVARLKAGMIFNLRNSDRVDFASPSRPSDNTDQYVKRLESMFAFPFRIPYAILFQDLNDVNYASFKAGMQETKRTIGRWQRILSVHLTRIVEFFVDELVSKRMLPRSFDKSKIRIVFPKMGVIEEEAKARADKINITQTQTSSRHDVTESTDTDYDELQEDLTQEALDIAEREAVVLKRKKELEEKYGIIFPDTVQEQDRQTSRRIGEQQGSDLDEEDARERREEDGNY